MIVRHNMDMPSGIRITDSEHRVIYDKQFSPELDTTFLYLQPEKSYHLLLEGMPESDGEELMLSLYLNGLPIIVAHEGMDPGDHSIPFVTGYGNPQLRIVGGTSTSIQNYPWQVFVRAGNFICGGTIIADKWVLTAAHCLYDNEGDRIPDNQVSITAGAERPLFSSVDGTVYPIDYSVIHEDYGLGEPAFQNDLALLRSTEKIDDEFSQPLNLITTEDVNNGATDPGVEAIITGWGVVDVENDELAVELQEAKIPIVSNDFASLVWGPLPDNMLMAGSVNEEADACSGDSGGPLIVEVDGEYKLAGITSWGSINCNTIGGYTRVSSFTDWLAKNSGVGQNEFITVRAKGDGFFCSPDPGEIFISSYSSDTLEEALAYEWKIEPEEAGLVIANFDSADVTWSNQFSGEAYVSVRAALPAGFTNWAGQRVVKGENTRIIAQSADTSLCESSQLALSVSAIGTNLTYNWYRENFLVRTSQDSSYFIGSLQQENEGIYKVEAVGDCGIVQGDEIFIDVLETTRIIDVSSEEPVIQGADIDITADVAGDNLEYIWTKDGNVLPSETAGNIEFRDIDASATGLYQLRLEGTCGIRTSSRFYLYVDPSVEDFPDDINIWPTLTTGNVNIAVDFPNLFDVYVYSQSGVYYGKLEDKQYKTEFDLSYLPAGMYIIRVVAAGEDYIYRTMKVNN